LLPTSSEFFAFLSAIEDKLHNGDFHNLYSSPNIIRMIKSRSMRWAGHVAQVGKKKNAYRILVGKPKEGDH
jgi:hypothetical protein